MSETGPRPPGEVVGVLGGTFDPVHLGHLHVASGVLDELRLSRVLLMPCSLPPHKDRPRLTGGEHRLAMLRLAVAGRDGLEASPLELERGGVSYTIDTLRALRAILGGSTPAFILGLDALIEIRLWHDYRSLLREFDLVAVDRPGSDIEAVRSTLGSDIGGKIVPGGSRAIGAGGFIHHVRLPRVAVSSSEVRARAARGEPLDGLVPPGVATYIHREGLYRQEAGT